MRLAALMLIAAAAASPQTSFESVSFEVTWKRGPLPDKRGVLHMDEEGVTFQASGAKQRERSWRYLDIQHFERVSRTEIAIRSYDDSAWRLGQDRRYRFALRDSEIGDELFESVVDRIGKPATDRVALEPPQADLEIAAKRLKRSGGSQGTLYFASDRIVYSSPSAGHSRTWMLDRDVDTVWSADPYRLEVHVYEGTERFARPAKVYRFALKTRLDEEFYRRLKIRLYASGR